MAAKCSGPAANKLVQILTQLSAMRTALRLLGSCFRKYLFALISFASILYLCLPITVEEYND